MNQVFAGQQVAPETFIDALQSAPSDPPEPGAEYVWRCTQQMSVYAYKEMRGTLLEFMAASGNLGFYRDLGRARGALSIGKAALPEDSRMVKAAADFCLKLISLGEKPTPGCVNYALSCGLRNLDTAERLALCEKIGAFEAMDPRQAVLAAAREGYWDKEAMEKAWETLKRFGALDKMSEWNGGPAETCPVAVAVRARNDQGVRLAIRDGAALDWRDPITGATLWHLAAVCGPQQGKALLAGLAKDPKARALADAKTIRQAAFEEKDWKIKSGQTPLHAACADVEPLAAQTLLECGADPNALDAQGWAPIHWLAKRYSKKAQKRMDPLLGLLLEKGADPSAKTPRGQTAAQIMAPAGPADAIVKLLEAHPESVSGDGAEQKRALGKIMARGDGMLSSAAEKSVMQGQLGEAAQGEEAAPAGRKKAGL